MIYVKITKIINNNIVSTFDKDNKELVVMGKGLGFGTKIGREIEESKIEKIFKMETNADAQKLEDLFSDMPIEHIKITSKIIQYAKNVISIKINEYINIALTSHIDFAIERQKQGLEFTNSLLWAVKRFYQSEFKVGKYALELIKNELGVKLPESEAASIALHFINAELGNSMPQTIDTTKLIQGICDIVKYEFKQDIKEDTLDYERFVTHIKFFSQRILNSESLENDDDELYDMIKSGYPKYYACAKKIAKYVENLQNVEVSKSEKVFLAVHIRRIISYKIK